MFDVFQTYQPSGALALRVPAHPEGLPAADHFDTYWGELADLDFKQAQGLRCNYPTPIPQAGDYLTVADTLPEPATGEGYYYVTAVTHMGETRDTRIREYHEENRPAVVGLREGAWLRRDGDVLTLEGTSGAKLFQRGKAPEEIATGTDLSFLLVEAAS